MASLSELQDRADACAAEARAGAKERLEAIMARPVDHARIKRLIAEDEDCGRRWTAALREWSAALQASENARQLAASTKGVS